MNPVHWCSHALTEIPDSFDWLASTERERFERMPFRKRRSESMLGRWTAKHAVCAVLDMEPSTRNLARVLIRNAADGAPEVFVDDVPAGHVIAMTDRADWAVAALREGDARIGVDLELVEPRSDRFIEDYFTVSEREAARAGEFDLMANLIWSAKESSLKVLRTGLRRDTRSVEVTLEGGDGTAWSPFTVRVDGGPSHHGVWRRFGSFVLTAAASVPIGSPVSLQDPMPLATATPAHSWMDNPLIG